MDALLEQLRALPAAAPLLARLGDRPGVYVVGGAVRDLLLGGTPYDLDLVVEGDAAEVAAALDGERRVHDRFGTSTVELDGFTYDIATARRESYARPGALPDVVVPASLDDDLRRRDFTVNAIAIGLGGPGAGELRAAEDALEDLEARRLRVLHDRSFIDDPTRMLRLARYASRLGFSVDPRTRALVDPRALATVSGARVGAELRLLAREPDPVPALLELGGLGVDAAIHPGFGLRDPEPARRALALLPRDGRPDRLVLGVAARPVPVSELGPLLDRLAFEAADREAIVAAASRADHLAGELGAATPSEVARAAAGAGPELVALAGALGPERPAAAWLDELRHLRLEINGGDLLAAGVPQGPAIGRGLSAALAAKLDGRAGGRVAELAEALRAARATGVASDAVSRFFTWGEHFAIDLAGARAVFTTRRGGFSEGPYASLNLGRLTDDDPATVERNREVLTDQLGVPMALIRQVHGTRVLRLTAPPDGELPEADGQATTRLGMAPLVMTADCLPVAIAGDGAVAMLHAGWRGLAGGVLQEGVAAMRELGAAGRLAAAIGPGAGACCYEVGEEVHAAFAPSYGAEARRGRHLDMKRIARTQLERAGVAEVHDIGMCTICGDPSLFFSHRRDRGVTGRQGGAAWLR